jgi:uncharacterized membrane protein YfcA
MSELFYILILLFIVAFFYSSVGHGGASGYLAVLSIIGISTLIIRPSVLVLNIFVAGISFYHYYRGGHFRWKLFYPFAVLSIPMAYLGSFVVLNPILYKQILGVCLLIAVARIMGFFNRNQTISTKQLPILAGILIGAALGFASGVIGIGGGIILSPLILLFNWGTLKETSAVSALFIVVNSIAGMLGFWKQGIILHPQFFLWLVAAISGGFIGSYWGSKRAQNTTLKNVLAVVLLFAAIKLIFI